jgi:hypothetical protein
LLDHEHGQPAFGQQAGRGHPAQTGANSNHVIATISDDGCVDELMTSLSLSCVRMPRIVEGSQEYDGDYMRTSEDNQLNACLQSSSLAQ